MLDVQKPRIGLALGSGAARGWAHIGVLRAFSELGIPIDVICGTSMGALVGGFHLCGRLGDLEAWARQLTTLRMVRYLDLRFVRSGLVASNRLFAEIKAAVGSTLIEDLPIPFASVATDLTSGHELWISQGRLMDAIKASFALPGLFEPMKMDNRWVIDGAIVNPVPVSVCRALGAQVIIAINLNTAPPGKWGVPGVNGVSPGCVDAVSGAPGSIWQNIGSGPDSPATAEENNSDAPKLLSVIASTLNIVQDRVTRSRLAADPPDVSIIPRVGHIGLMDFQTASEVIDRGSAAVFQAESEIRNAIQSVGVVGQ